MNIITVKTLLPFIILFSTTLLLMIEDFLYYKVSAGIVAINLFITMIIADMIDHQVLFIVSGFGLLFLMLIEFVYKIELKYNYVDLIYFIITVIEVYILKTSNILNINSLLISTLAISLVCLLICIIFKKNKNKIPYLFVILPMNLLLIFTLFYFYVIL